MANVKPSVDALLDYLPKAIPNCRITQEEINDFKELYDNVEYNDIYRVYHQAIDRHSMQPLSLINRQLRIIKPSSDPFNPQVKKRSFSNKSVEQGTDWKAVSLRFEKFRSRTRAEYDAKHGKGAFDKRDKETNEFIHKSFVYSDVIDGSIPDNGELTEEDKALFQDEERFSKRLKEAMEFFQVDNDYVLRGIEK